MAAIASALGTYDILEKPATHYECGNLVMARCQDDEVLAYAYSRFKREGILDILFYEQNYSLIQFVQKYLEENTATLACFSKDPLGNLNLVGIGWINEFFKMRDFLRCNAGMGFFRRKDGEQPQNLVMLGQMMVEWAFDHLNIDAMHGVTPAGNRAAVAWSKKVGFLVSGPVEGGTVWKGELADVWMSSMTKARWAEKRPWKETR